MIGYNNRIGYCCLCLSLEKDKVTTNRGMVKRTFLEKGLTYVFELAVKNTDDLIKIIRFINFGETRTSEESSYYLFSGNRIANLALQYNIPIKAWVVDLIPSRRDVRQFAEQSGAASDPLKFKKLLRRETGKENIDDLNARERFKIIQSLKNF